MTAGRVHPHSAMIGLGCMRLESSDVIATALEAGVVMLDTARAYGESEALVAEAVRAHPHGSRNVEIVTKGGMLRPRAGSAGGRAGVGRWVPNGREKQLRADCEISLETLGKIDLYLLHAPDPRIALATSVKALAKLQAEGMVSAIGLCNVTLPQLIKARAVADIAAVQLAISPLDDDALFSGIVRYCIEERIRVIAHSPLGGPRKSRGRKRSKLARHGSIEAEALGAIAQQLAVTPQELALAWLADLGVEPIPGATRRETAASLGRAQAIVLSEEMRAGLDAIFPGGTLARTPKLSRKPAAPDGEVVLLMGIQGAGKSDAAEAFQTRGYRRLNRDARGGRLSGLLAPLSDALAGGQRHVVLDNTYGRRAARSRVVEIAWRHGAAARCVWLDTPLAEAQINAVRRLRQKYGALPMPDELKKLSKTDPHAFDPRAQFRFERNFEEPSADEGFSAIERIAFERRHVAHAGKGIIVQCENVLRASKRGARAPASADDVVLKDGAKEALHGFAADGYVLCAFSWQPEAGADVVAETFARTRELLDVNIHFACCPHPAGPPICWCRTPLPGLVIGFIDEHELDPTRSILIGKPPADRTLAERIGLSFRASWLPTTEP